MDRLFPWDPLDLSHWGTRGSKDVEDILKVFKNISGACDFFSGNIGDANEVLRGKWDCKIAWYLLWSINGHLALVFGHVFDVVSERILPKAKLSSKEQRSLQRALRLALNQAENLRGTVETYIANALANGCKVDSRYPNKRPYLSQMVQGTKTKPQIPAAPALEYLLRLIFKSVNRGGPNREPQRFKYPKGDSTAQEFLAAQLKWLPTLSNLCKGPASIKEVGEGKLHMFEYGVPRCVAYCAHHETTGSSQAVWEGFSSMKKRAAEMRDYRLPSEGKVHKQLFEIYQTHDRIIEKLQAKYLSTKTKEFGDKEWESKMKYRCRSEASQIFRSENPRAPTLQHSFELAQSYHGNNLTNFDKCWRCKAIAGWEMPFVEEQGDEAWKGIDNEKGGYPKTKFGRCAEGKLHLACWEVGHPEDRP